MILLTKKVSNKLLVRTLLCLISFLSFVQLGFHFWTTDSFVYGVGVDFLAPTIYVTDLLIVLFLVSVFWEQKRQKKILNAGFVNYFLVLLGFALVNSAVALNVFVALFKWLKIFELVLLFRVLSVISRDVLSKYVLKPFVYSSLFVVPLGFAQMFIGGSTKLFTFLGERLFNIDTPGIASRSIFGHDTLRAYSTFSHPNSFSGYLLIVVAFSLLLNKKGYLTKTNWAVLTFTAMVGIVSTMSISSFFCLLVISFFWKMNRPRAVWLVLVLSVFFSLSLPFLSLFMLPTNLPQAANLRFEQYTSVFTVFKNFLLGVGMNNTILLQKGLPFAPFTFQPLHNVFLLFFVELGLVGFAGFLFALFTVGKKAVSSIDTALLFLAMSLPLLFDHYQFTLQQNLLATTFALSYLWSKTKESVIL